MTVDNPRGNPPDIRWVTRGQQVSARWTTDELSTGVRLVVTPLWEGVDDRARRFAPLTWVDARSSTIHRPYHHHTCLNRNPSGRESEQL
jgi:hypothetical protein